MNFIFTLQYLKRKRPVYYLDESGFDEFYYKTHGYSLRGQPIYQEVLGKRFQRTNVIAALHDKQIIVPFYNKGNVDAQIFETWLEKFFLPSIPRRSVIVMDNAPFHRKEQIYAIARKRKCRVIFLPPYSPNLNPIEPKWANTKKKLRKETRGYQTFDMALSHSLGIV